MKEKILAAIKAMFPGINLTKKRLDAIVAKIEPKVGDDESKIDAEIKTYNEYNPVAELAKSDDKLRDLEVKLKTKKDETKPGSDKDEEPEVDPDTPKWAKSLIDQNKKLADDLAALKGEKIQADIKSKAAEQFKTAGVPTSFWEGRALPEKEDALEEFVTKTTGAYDAHLQELKNQGLSVARKPIVANGGKETETKDEKKATEDEVKQVLENIL